MVLNVSRSQHLVQRSKPSSTLLFSNNVPLTQVLATKDLGVIIQNKFNFRSQVDTAVSKVMSMYWRTILGGEVIMSFGIINSFVSVNPDAFFSFHMSRNLFGAPVTLTKPRTLTCTHK